MMTRTRWYVSLAAGWVAVVLVAYGLSVLAVHLLPTGLSFLIEIFIWVTVGGILFAGPLSYNSMQRRYRGIWERQ
jgi:hypothetical protein